MMDVEHTALILVDPYNDFLSWRGQTWPMVRNVILSNGMIGKASAILSAARAHHMTVAYAPHCRWRPEGFSGRKYLHPSQFIQNRFRTFSAGRFGGELLPELAPVAGDVIASEHQCSSGFAGTNLHEQLQSRGITHLVIIGMITNSCIEATARSAVDLGYHVTLVTDAVAAFAPVEHDLAIQETFPQIAHQVTDTSSLLASLRG